MGSRRRTHPTISLFAFQDVIMSVSGIIIVVVLLLALELVERPAVGQPGGSAAVARELAAATESALRERALHEAALADADRLVREAAQVSPDELRRRIESERNESARLEGEISKLQEQIVALEGELKELEVRRFDSAVTQAELAAATAAADELRDTIERERSENRPLFSLPHGMNRQGWIAVVSGTEISVAPLGRSAPPQTFRAGGLFGSSQTSAFMDWIRASDLSGAYFLLLIRPDGISAFADLQEEFDLLGISYGFDVVAADQLVLHPERGAYE